MSLCGACLYFNERKVKKLKKKECHAGQVTSFLQCLLFTLIEQAGSAAKKSKELRFLYFFLYLCSIKICEGYVSKVQLFHVFTSYKGRELEQALLLLNVAVVACVCSCANARALQG